MSARSKTDLKNIYVSGARPTQENFADLIDSWTDYSELLQFISTALSTKSGFISLTSASATTIDVIPFNKGGTGEQSQASARTALGIPTIEAGLATLASANTFTQDQTIISSASAEGPRLILKNYGSVSAIGALLLKGIDSNAASSTYAKIRGNVVSRTAGDETGSLQFITVVSGASAIRFNLSRGVYASGQTDQGEGTINLPVDGGFFHGGTRIPWGQVETSAFVSATSITTVIPYDDTIPQITEGNEILAMGFTPQHADSTLKIEIVAFFGATANVNQTMAIFQDSTADALKAQSFDMGNLQGGVFSWHTFINANSTSHRTYRLRIGPQSGTCRINSNGDGSDIFSTVGPECRMTITEILP